MICRFALLPFCLVLLTSGMPAISAPAEGADWHWVHGMPHPGHWDIAEGVGTISINGQHFTADLRNSAKPADPVEIHLEGDIKGTTVVATATYLESGAGKETFSGTFNSQQITKTMAMDNITLSGELANGYLALNRRMPVVPKP